MRLAWCAKRWQASSVRIRSSRTGPLWEKPCHPYWVSKSMARMWDRVSRKVHKKGRRATWWEWLWAGSSSVSVLTSETYQQINMLQTLPGKARCSTGSRANAIKCRAKYTCRFMFPMPMLIAQIECYKFQQLKDNLLWTLITADRRWNVVWGEQTVLRLLLSSWVNVTLWKQSTLTEKLLLAKAKKKGPAFFYWRLTLKAEPQQQNFKTCTAPGILKNTNTA